MKKVTEAQKFYARLHLSIEKIHCGGMSAVRRAGANSYDEMEFKLVQVAEVFDKIKHAIKLAEKENATTGHKNLNYSNLYIMSTIAAQAAYIDHNKDISSMKDVFFEAMNKVLIDNWKCNMMNTNRNDEDCITYGICCAGDVILAPRKKFAESTQKKEMVR